MKRLQRESSNKFKLQLEILYYRLYPSILSIPSFLLWLCNIFRSREPFFLRVFLEVFCCPFRFNFLDNSRGISRCDDERRDTLFEMNTVISERTRQFRRRVCVVTHFRDYAPSSDGTTSSNVYIRQNGNVSTEPAIRADIDRSSVLGTCRSLTNSRIERMRSGISAAKKGGKKRVDRSASVGLIQLVQSVPLDTHR